MTWGALLGGLIGAGIPATLAYLGLRRHRQSSDAEAFGPALLVLYRMQPDRVMLQISNNRLAERTRIVELAQQTDTARERLLVVRAGHPRRRVRDLADVAQIKIGNVHQVMGWQVEDMLANKDNPERVEHYRAAYADAASAMTDLIDANFAWWELRRTKAAGRRIRAQGTAALQWANAATRWTTPRLQWMWRTTLHGATVGLRWAAARLQGGSRTARSRVRAARHRREG